MKKKKAEKIVRKEELEEDENKIEEKELRKEHKDKKEEKKEPKEDKKYEKQTKIAIILMFVFIFAIFLTYWLIQESKKFDYNGLKFEKIKFGELPLYHAKIPLFDTLGNLAANYNLYLRNDPRKLKDVAVSGEIRLMKNVVVAADENLICEDEAIAGSSLKGFLTKVVEINVFIGTTEQNKSNSNLIYADCNSDKFSTLIIEKADKTEIVQAGQNCYKIKVANCEIMGAVEKFMVELYKNSRMLI